MPLPYLIFESLEPEPKLPKFKTCVVCHKRFTRGRYISWQGWLRQKSCSRRCQALRRRNIDQKSYRINTGPFSHTSVFKCAICNKEIEGNKYDLKRHKYEAHGH